MTRALRGPATPDPSQGSPETGRGSVLVEKLDKTYQTRAGTVEAVRNVSFTVSAGEFVSLVGPSGCGKSTVLKIVAGLIPYEHGLVEVGGRPAEPGRRDCGIMFQSPVLLAWRTVRENVLLPIEVFGMDAAKGRRRAEDLLSTVGLADFQTKYPWELSGGMQQRVSLARLLVFEPSVLLLDEPFAALDEFTRERLNFELSGLHERSGRSVLYVTHNIHEAVVLSDRVVAMTSGPGRVVDTFLVDLPRPRTPDLLEDPRTVAFVAQIRAALRLYPGGSEQEV